jgi:hypothetical protein
MICSSPLEHSQYTWPWFDIINTACCVLNLFIVSCFVIISRSQLPRSLRRGSAAARLQWMWFRIPPWAWSFVYCECCVLSGRGLCDGLITCLQELYWVCCVQFVWSPSTVRGGHDRGSDQSAKWIKKSPNNKEGTWRSKTTVLSSEWKDVCLLWGRNWVYVAFKQLIICLNFSWL